MIEPIREFLVDYLEISCYNTLMGTAYRVGTSHSKRGEVMRMGIYEVLSLLFLGSTFLIAVLTYIDRHNRK